MKTKRWRFHAMLIAEKLAADDTSEGRVSLNKNYNCIDIIMLMSIGFGTSQPLAISAFGLSFFPEERMCSSLLRAHHRRSPNFPSIFERRDREDGRRPACRPSASDGPGQDSCRSDPSAWRAREVEMETQFLVLNSARLSVTRRSAPAAKAIANTRASSASRMEKAT